MKKRVVPANAIKNIRHKRNIIEAIIFTFLIGFIIFEIPFIAKAKLIFLIVCCSGSLFFFIRGYKNRSITQIIIAEILFRKRRRVTHLRSCDYIIAKNTASPLDEAEGETTLEKVIYITKRKIAEWKAKAREDLAKRIEQGEQRSENKDTKKE